MKGPIQRLARDRLDRRDDARLKTTWFGKDGTPAPNPGTSTIFRDHAGVTSVDRGGPVLILLAGEHPGALAELVAHAEAGARVYVLAPAGWGKGKLDTWIGQAPTVLIRRVPEVPVSGVLRASGSRIWAGATHGGSAPWCVRLDATQAGALRQIFLRLFWHDAVDEAWTGNKQLVFRPPAERPFDVPPAASSAPVRLIAAETRIEIVRGAVVHLSTDAPPDVTLRRLWIRPGGDHHDRLATLRRSGTEIGWTMLDLPDIVVGPGAGAALLPGARARLRVDLNAAQISDIERILSQLPAWRFDVDVRLGDHAELGVLFRLPGTGAAAALEREQVIEIGQVQAEQLRTAPQTAPASWPTPQPLALAVRYRWTVIPPRLPAGTEDDPIVGRWRKLDSDWSARLGKLRETLDDAEQHRGRLHAAFSRLLSALLGFERTHGSLRKELDALSAKTPSSAGPHSAPVLLDRLTALEEQARKLKGDLDETERKAREQQEREKQEAEWEARVKKAEQDLEIRRAQLSELAGRRPDLAAELAAIELELASVEKTAEPTEKSDTDKGQPKPAKPDDKPQGKAQGKPGASKATEQRKENLGKPDPDNAAGESNRTHKDRLARKQRLSDDLAKLDRDLKRLNGEVATLERQAAEQFTFAPSASVARPTGTGRFVPTAAAPRPPNQTPDEALPEVGELRRLHDQRFLVIDTWDALTTGEAAASRLRARLVAPEHA